jgi:hypothetical protein
MNAKLLIVLLVVLVILFVVGLAGGALRGSSSSNSGSQADLSPHAAQSLGDLLVKPAPLTAQDISAAAPADCAAGLSAGFTLLPGLPCTLFVQASQGYFSPVRTLKVSLAQGVAASITFRPGSDGLTATYKLDGDHSDANVQIFKEGGVLELACLSGGAGQACFLQVK